MDFSFYLFLYLAINKDKTVNLHTRSLKYGKLTNGLLVEVFNKLIKTQQNHFKQLACGVNVIFSHNGKIWLNNVSREGIVKEQLLAKPYSN